MEDFNVGDLVRFNKPSSGYGIKAGDVYPIDSIEYDLRRVWFDLSSHGRGCLGFDSISEEENKTFATLIDNKSKIAEIDLSDLM